MYRSEQKVGEILGAFSFLAILTACLGLFGLASFTAEQRTKEIGVRKILGASVPGIVVMLCKDFGKFVLIASLIASPIAWYLMREWLSNFAYRTNLGIQIFFLATILALVIAILTVSIQAIRAALTNPVEALRYE